MVELIINKMKNQATIYNKRKFNRITPHLFDEIFKLTKNRKKILDVGSARGHLGDFLKSKKINVKYKGIDMSKNQIKIGMKNGLDLTYCNLDESNIPFKSNSFDLIICTEVIEHVFDTDHLLSEIERVLEPQGIVFITTPNIASLGNRLQLIFGKRPGCIDCRMKGTNGHINAFTLKDLRILFQDNGLATIVGTSVGNNATGATTLTPFKLPKTKSRISIATSYRVRPNKDKGIIQIPDYWVEYTLNNLMTGKDPYLEKIMELMESGNR